MSERIEDYLEGRLDQGALSPTEREDAETAKRVIAETRGFVAARPAPDLSAAVMRRIAEMNVAPAPADVNAFRRFLRSLWAPRQLHLQWRPAYALVGVSALLLLAMFVPYGWRTPLVPQQSASTRGTADQRVFVQFRLDAPNAMDVRLAGSFTNWQPRYQLHEASPGVWTITVPLSAGVHDYVFVVNGQRWIPDPYAQHVDDGFGGVNSRIALVAPDSPSL
jgi:hypothetical protein